MQSAHFPASLPLLLVLPLPQPWLETAGVYTSSSPGRRNKSAISSNDLLAVSGKATYSHSAPSQHTTAKPAKTAGRPKAFTCRIDREMGAKHAQSGTNTEVLTDSSEHPQTYQFYICERDQTILYFIKKRYLRKRESFHAPRRGMSR